MVWVWVCLVLSQGQAADLWSTRPLVRPPNRPTEAATTSLAIDQIISQGLQANDFKPLPLATPRDLVVRVHLDLTGLPPTALEADAFVADPSPKAYEALVDRLLKSRPHAEHWARHWLDVARYADSKGYAFLEERTLPFAWTYRDWVIGALEADIPYDRFVRLQIAGDLLPDAKPKDKAALGFLTLGRRFLNNLPDILDDRVDVVGRGLLGLTVSCARCHDHKHDPITMRDYYGLYSIFANAPETKDLPRLNDELPDVAAQEFSKEQARRDRVVAEYVRLRMEIRRDSFRTKAEVKRYLLAIHADSGEITKLATEGEFNPFVWERWKEFLEEVPPSDPVLGPWRQLGPVAPEEFAKQARELDATKYHPLVAKVLSPSPLSREELAGRYAELLTQAKWDQSGPIYAILFGPKAPMNVPDELAGKLFGRADRDQQRDLQRQADEWRAATPAVLACAMVVKDKSPVTVQKIMRRGNPAALGDSVVARLPEVLGGLDSLPFKEGSGRAELAQALTSGKARNLLARVIVNRVWAWHFGEGLVRTPSDFGNRGDLPTHPQLLELLAFDFVANDMSLRWLHKTILLTDVYRRASLEREPSIQDEADPDNRWLARQNRRRLDFESLRDRLLNAAGSLNTQGGGPADALFTAPFPHRRTIYGFVDRQNLPSTWVALDGPNPDSHLPKRTTTLTPAQGLFWLNHPLVIEASQFLANRLPGGSDAQKCRHLFRAVLARDPSEKESSALQKALASMPETPLIKRPANPWSHGMGAVLPGWDYPYFSLLTFFTGESWQATPLLPRPGTGKLQLTAEGGHPGPSPSVAAIRRFTVPSTGNVTIQGTVFHPDYRGDGVRVAIVHNVAKTNAVKTIAAKTIWQQKVHNERKNHDTKLIVKAGDTIDFVTDCGNDPGNDAFFWSPLVQYDSLETFSATTGFAGPLTPPLDRWGLLAQTLFWTTEFQWIP